jgi:hypothetical protein
MKFFRGLEALNLETSTITATTFWRKRSHTLLWYSTNPSDALQNAFCGVIFRPDKTQNRQDILYYELHWMSRRESLTRGLEQQAKNKTTHPHNKWLCKVLCSLHYMSYEVTYKLYVIRVTMAHFSRLREGQLGLLVDRKRFLSDCWITARSCGHTRRAEAY